MNFRYLDSLNPSGSSHKRPCILTVFRNGSERLEQYALVDSGADMSAIDCKLAKKLGLDLGGKRIQSYTASGIIESVISHVDVDVGKGHEHYSFNIPIRVLMTADDYVSPTLLGRMGFFDKFRITFDESNQKLSMKTNGQD